MPRIPDPIEVGMVGGFDRDGLGPDEIKLEVYPLPDLGIHDSPCLSLRVRAAGLVMRSEVDGGYMMSRAAVVMLHEQFGAWLKFTEVA